MLRPASKESGVSLTLAANERSWEDSQESDPEEDVHRNLPFLPRSLPAENDEGDGDLPNAKDEVSFAASLPFPSLLFADSQQR